MGLFEGLWGSFWVDIRQVKSWYKHRELDQQGNVSWRAYVELRDAI